jgi:hypothetical protein
MKMKTQLPKPMDTAKLVPRGKFIAMSVNLKKKSGLKYSNDIP